MKFFARYTLSCEVQKPLQKRIKTETLQKGRHSTGQVRSSVTYSLKQFTNIAVELSASELASQVWHLWDDALRLVQGGGIQ